MSLVPSLRSRFQGCLVGAVIGDCIGAPFESIGVRGPNFKPVLDFVDTFGKEIKGSDKLEYTDDTAMARCVAESLIAHNSSLKPQDLARRFGEEFKMCPTRGYGENVVTVLRKLDDPDIPDVFGPAQCQFNGGGSYGNGGAMRVAPVALCGKDNVDKVIKDARTSALLTHSNKLGFNGAIVQALAVHKALHMSKKDMNSKRFAKDLLSLVKERVECPPTNNKEEEDDSENDENLTSRTNKKRKLDSNDDVYCQRLQTMGILLKGNPSLSDIVSDLGNSISAHNSVCTAVYSFIRCLTPVEGLPTENGMERTILYAVSLDGDTDTIASMAGAIAGAFYGVESIPEQWRTLCEGCDTALRQADQLYDIYLKNYEAKKDVGGSSEACCKCWNVK